MDTSRRPSTLKLSLSHPASPISSAPSSAHRHSQSPFRYMQLDPYPEDLDEKSTPLADIQTNLRPHSPGRQRCSSPSSPNRAGSGSQLRSNRTSPQSPATPNQPPLLRQPPPLHRSNRTRSQISSTYTRPRGLRIANLIRPWIPIIMYIITSLAFVAAIALYKEEVFSRLDQLSHWLKSDKYTGYAILFCLIFITTFPPVPLYSTLITLSGYTFGAWTGAVISYLAALSGALTVFIISRTFFRDAISRWLSCTLTIRRVVHAVEKRPKLLFLIRLAPYPYNVMNCLLAAAPTLTLRTYTLCTGLSLFKVIIHTSMGSSIASFKDYHGKHPKKDDGAHEFSAAELWTILGIVLCTAILIYISIVARKAVHNELDDDEPAVDAEERVGFLSAHDLETGHGDEDEETMVESPFRAPHQLIPYRVSMEHS
ncbi:hypothetical protein DXG01_007932 [Tephrocybe rancida]|nr:hypothetical protein DXG01_007932 [Tephrocybe rancida]